MSGGRNVLIVFLKNPVRGRVKTRLALEAGEDQALRIYIQLLRHTIDRAESSGADVHYWFAEEMPDRMMRSMLPKGASVHLQNTIPDLGLRMKAAILTHLETGDKVVIIGSDCPGIQDETIRRSFRLLDEKDFVVGPASDGGFYLLGLTRWQRGMFDEIKWSEPDVFKRLIANIEAEGNEIFLLDVLRDVDYWRDWIATRHLLGPDKAQG